MWEGEGGGRWPSSPRCAHLRLGVLARAVNSELDFLGHARVDASAQALVERKSEHGSMHMPRTCTGHSVHAAHRPRCSPRTTPHAQCTWRTLSDEIASSSEFFDGSSPSPGVSFDSISPLIELANGRACSIIFSAPFSLDAATIFMALVILAVDKTDFIRRPIALMDGMVHQPATNRRARC